MTEFSELSSEDISERQSSEPRDNDVVVGRLILEAESQISTADSTTATPTSQPDEIKQRSYFNDSTNHLSHRSERRSSYEEELETLSSDALLTSGLSLNGDASGRNSEEKGKNWRFARSNAPLSDEDDAVEDYDELEIDQSALVADCRGGGLEKQSQGQPQSYFTAGEGLRSDLPSIDGDNGTQIRLKR